MTFCLPVTAGEVEKHTLTPTVRPRLFQGRGTAKRHLLINTGRLTGPKESSEWGQTV